MAKLLSFLLRDNAPRDDSRGQPMDSATVRRWLTERAYVNPSNLDCEHCVYYTEWGVPWQILRAVRRKQRPPFWHRFLLLLRTGSRRTRPKRLRLRASDTFK